MSTNNTTGAGQVIRTRFWGRSTPGRVFGSAWDETTQLFMLEQGLAGELSLHGAKLEFVTESTGNGASSAEPNCLLAVGDATLDLLKFARERSLENVVRADGVVRKTVCVALQPAYDTAILVLPDLPPDAFRSGQDPYALCPLALESIGRVVVLACGRDMTITGNSDNGQQGRVPLLGRGGPSGPTDPRVTVVDISHLIDFHGDAAYGVFRSLEALGLIRRLIGGASVSASINASAVIVDRALP